MSGSGACNSDVSYAIGEINVAVADPYLLWEGGGTDDVLGVLLAVP